MTDQEKVAIYQGIVNEAQNIEQARQIYNQVADPFAPAVPTTFSRFANEPALVAVVIGLLEATQQKGAAWYWQQRFAQANNQRLALIEQLEACQNPPEVE